MKQVLNADSVKTITIDQLVGGLFAGLVLEKRTNLHKTIYDSEFHYSFAKAYSAIKPLLEKEGITTRFDDTELFTDSITGYSNRIAREMEKYRFILDVPITMDQTQIMLSPQVAQERLNKLPGSNDLYLNFAKEFLAVYDGISEK